MTEPVPQDQETASPAKDDSTMVMVCYALHLAAIINGLTAIVAVVIAYINQADAPQWLKSHYQFQIRTFWIGLAASIIAGLLTMVFIGFLLFIAIFLWWVIRLVKGIKYLNEKKAHPDPTTWMLG